MSLYNASEESVAPTTPSSARQVLYPKSTGWFVKNAAGTESQLATVGGALGAASVDGYLTIAGTSLGGPSAVWFGSDTAGGGATNVPTGEVFLFLVAQAEVFRYSATGIGVTGTITATTSILASGATGGVGYKAGAGGAVTQGTNRTTGVTLDKICGSITLVSAAGSASWQSFTVTNSAVAATDTVIVVQKSGTDLYQIHVTAVAAGSFRISFATTGGTTTEQPVFNFSVIKAAAS